jgi:hypothetical protein
MSPPASILFIGDSITFHSPREHLGWDGAWGMAASAQKRDYVHRFYARLCESQTAQPPKLFVSGRVAGTEQAKGRIDGHLTSLEKYRALAADLIIVQLGENELDHEVTPDTFEAPYERLVRGASASHKPLILCTGVWRDGPTADTCNDMIKAVCQRTGAVFVPVAPIRAAAAVTAAHGLFANTAVADHPGDRGHELYAKALWNAFAPHLAPSVKHQEKHDARL